MRISPLGIADIFQSTNNLSSKVDCVHEPASGQDIQEVPPCTIEKRSEHRLPVIIHRPLKFTHFLQ
jgi:hypothetical protein